MAYISDFVPFIVSNTGEVLEVQIQHLLRMSIAAFMTDTGIAQDELYAEIRCNESDFLLDLPECRSLVRVQSVWEAPASCHSSLLDENKWNQLTSAGMARGRAPRHSANTYRINKVGRNPKNSVILGETATKTRNFCVIYSWKITGTACEVPDFILDDWVDAIIYRTMAYLHSSLDFEQRSPTERATMLALYDMEVAKAKTQLRADYGNAVIRMKTPPNFY